MTTGTGKLQHRIVTLLAVIAMMIVAAASGYRLQIGVSGMTFERDAPRPAQGTHVP